MRILHGGRRKSHFSPDVLAVAMDGQSQGKTWRARRGEQVPGRITDLPLRTARTRIGRARTGNAAMDGRGRQRTRRVRVTVGSK